MTIPVSTQEKSSTGHGRRILLPYCQLKRLPKKIFVGILKPVTMTSSKHWKDAHLVTPSGFPAPSPSGQQLYRSTLCLQTCRSQQSNVTVAKSFIETSRPPHPVGRSRPVSRNILLRSAASPSLTYFTRVRSHRDCLVETRFFDLLSWYYLAPIQVY
jgi:hypothetical protein